MTTLQQRGFDQSMKSMRIQQDLVDVEIQELYERMQELLPVDDEPTTFEEASVERNWKQDMESELKSIERNNTWTLTQLTPNRKAMGLK